MSYRGPDPKPQSLTAEKSSSAGEVIVQASNTSNTASSAATVRAKVAGASAHDPKLHLDIDGVADWSIGIDNSDSDKLKISASEAVAGTTAVTIDSSGNVTAEGDIIAKDELKIEDGGNTGAIAWAPTTTRTATIPDATGTLAMRSDPIETARTHAVSSADYTITDSDGYDTILMTTGASQRTVTLPAVANNDGRELTIKKVDSGAGTVLVDTPSSETIDGAAQNVINAEGGWIRIRSDGSNWHVVSVWDEVSSAGATGVTINVGAAAYTQVDSLSIPAGKWRIEGFFFLLGYTSQTLLDTALTTTAAGSFSSSVALGLAGEWARHVVQNGGSAADCTVSGCRPIVALTSATTYRAHMQGHGSSGNGSGSARIHAVRIG